MTYSAVVLADSPRVYWRLGESSGGPVDSSGNGIDGVYYSPFGSTASGPYAPERNVTGLLAADVNGAVRIASTSATPISSYVATGWPSPSVTQVTLEAWIIPGTMPSSGDDRVIVCLGANASVNTALLYLVHDTTTIRFSYKTGGFNRLVSSGAPSLTVGVTYHVVGTFDGTTGRLYVNGAEVASTAIAGTLDSPPTNFGILAQPTGPYYFSGTIDEVAFYTTALSAARILAHYNEGVAPVPPTPGVPTSVAVDSITSASARLTWVAPASGLTPTGYDVRLNGGAPVDVGNVLNYTWTGLTASTSYTAEVRAH